MREIISPVNILRFDGSGTSIVTLFSFPSSACKFSSDMIKGIKDKKFSAARCMLKTCTETIAIHVMLKIFK